MLFKAKRHMRKSKKDKVKFFSFQEEIAYTGVCMQIS